MKITVNGEGLRTSKTTIAGLIEELGLRPGAVEVNLVIVSRKDYGTFRLKEGDSVEIVNFVGGG
ncbi:MAG: sulfur carrier protein ThiS [Thermodesulfovibrionales bacterium]|nr:sulfur carrier protein ThiS [Thermodesulfovibrionales bacterium]